MTNFDFLLTEPKFEAFSRAAVNAERVYGVDAAAAVIGCRRAMEFAVKWMYSVDGALQAPYQDTLVSLMGTEEFRDVVGGDLWKRMDFVRRVANGAAHSGKAVDRDQALLCLENLFVFLDFVACCYADSYEPREFDKGLIRAGQAAAPTDGTSTRVGQAATPTDGSPSDVGDGLAHPAAESSPRLEELLAENAALKAELTSRREAQQENYVPKPLELSEYKTRKLYIDQMLRDADWVEGKNWLNEVELPGMPNRSEVGYADYVLYGDDGRPLAVVEAKRTCVDVAKGRQQAV